MPKHFTLNELTRSAAAVQRGIDNTPPPEVRLKLLALINNCLDPIREMWGGPITVNSGFRCPVLNKAVGGSLNSQHMRGEAADITTGSAEGNEKLFRMIEGSGIAFDQLIDECGYSWLHVSYTTTGNRRNVLHL